MIDERKAYTYFKNRFVLKPSTNGWTTFDCPFCVKGDLQKKMAFNLESEFVKCWVCDWRGTIVDFVMEQEGKSYFDAKHFIHNQKATAIDLDDIQLIPRGRKVSDVELPYGFVPIAEGNGIIAKRARNYLLDRGFTLEYLDEQGFGYCNEHPPKPAKGEPEIEDYYGYIIIPLKKQGRLKYFIGRDFMGGFPRYKNPPTELFGVGKNEVIFNEDALMLKKLITISEGWADAATMGDVGTATLGWNLSTEQKDMYMRSYAKTFIFIPDRGYYQKAIRTAMDFMDYKICKVVNIDLIPEEYGKDANEIGYDRILEQIKKTPVLTESLAFEEIM